MLRKPLSVLMLCLVLALTAASAAAQGVPAQIDAAVAALSQRLGITLTLEDLDNYTWSQFDATDASLGCPQEGQTYAQVVTAAYQFDLTYQGVVYDIRVSNDSATVVFCGESATSTEVTPEAGATAEPTAGDDILSNSLCPIPAEGSPSYPPTRLVAGIQAQVLPGLPNNLRAEPSVEAEVVGEIPAEAVFTVTAGPECATDGTLFWQVDYDGITGFTAEYSGGDYLIAPVAPAAAVTGGAAFDAATTGLTEVTRLQGNYASDLIWMPEGQLVVTGDAGSEGVFVYDALEGAPRVVADPDLMTALDTAAEGEFSSLLLLGGSDGGVRLWDITPGAAVVERVFLFGHNNPVSAVAYSSDSNQIASTGGLAFAETQDPGNEFAILLWDTATALLSDVALRGHAAEVLDIDFNADGSQLVSGGSDNTVRLWDVTDGTEIARFENNAGVTSAAFSPDGSQVAFGDETGAVYLAPVSDLTAAAVIFTHGGAVNDVVYAATGDLLVSVGADGQVALIATAADAPQAVTTPAAHAAAITDAAFNPDGTLLATISEDNTVKLWQAAGDAAQATEEPSAG